jgi:butyryl-CoA dehydrogenase/short/branched chain acyl-CoA dehydrogenase
MSSMPPLTQLTDDEEMFRNMVREFAEDKIRPKAAQMDRDARIDPELLKEFFHLGFMGIEIPERFGGAESNFFASVLAVEELSRVDASCGVIVDVQNTLVINCLKRFGSSEQHARWFPRLARDTVGAYALSEAHCGSDAFALRCRAVERDRGFSLTGRKMWITNAAEAGIFVVFANANPAAGYRGITAFVVERGFPGFAVGKKEDKTGIRASSTCELMLDDCYVPRENVLGEVGKGYKIAIETLNEGRIAIGAQMIGIARGALEQGIQYCGERLAFGKRIGEFQGVQFQVADMAAELEAARLLVYNAARLKDAGKPFLLEAAYAKYYSSNVAEKVSSQVVELFGGYGYTKEFPAEKYWRDSKIGKIYEGTSNMQLQTIAKHLLELRSNQ